MRNPATIAGLYAVTAPVDGDESSWLATSRAVLAGGAQVLQYRDKTTDATRREREAWALRALCSDYGRLFIVNDDSDLAARVGADGVHLGRDDGDVAQARQRLGPGAWIGLSCYADLERAAAGVAAGADYLAFGSVYASPTKPKAVRADSELLAAARARFALPLVAIGGITPANAGALADLGLDAIAVVSGLYGTSDPAVAATAYCESFRPTTDRG